MFTGSTRDLLFSETKMKECTSPLKDILSDILSHPGKCLRGRLLLLTADLGNNKGYTLEKVFSLAMGAEILHLATLVHDDLVDRGELRRGYPTVWKMWGDKSAVLVGDYLFATAYRMFNEYSTGKGMTFINTLIKGMVEAQMEEEANRFRPVDLDTYLLRIEKKTARFFQTVCLLGGEAASFPLELTSLCGNFGLAFGMAYQILDDMSDLVDNPKFSGKQSFRDWKNGIVNLPLLLLGDQDKIKLILERVSKEEEITIDTREDLFKILTEHEIPNKVRLIYNNYLKQAKKTLKKIESVLDRARKPCDPIKSADLESLIRQLIYKGRRVINNLNREG